MLGQSISGIDQFMDTVVDQIRGLNLQVPAIETPGQPAVNTPILVSKRYLPRRSDNMDPATQIIVFRSDEPETLKYVGMGGKQWLIYLVYVVLVTPGQQDLASNLDLYHQWRGQMMSLFLQNGPNGPFSTNWFGIKNLFEVRVVPDVFLPRQQLAIEFNYMAFGLKPKFQGA